MDNRDSSGGVEGVDESRLFYGRELPVDTNLIPWPKFLLVALRRYPADAGMVAGGFMMAALIGAGIVWLAAPQFVLQTPLLFALTAYAGATMVTERLLCRSVFVLRPEHGRAVADEQRWWRTDERLIPDVFKRDDPELGRPTAFLYPQWDAKEPTKRWYEPFTGWSEPLVIKDDMASAAYVGGVRTTMTAGANLAKHQEEDRSDVARYGLIVVIVLFGLLAVYLAGAQAIDAFTDAGTTGTEQAGN